MIIKNISCYRDENIYQGHSFHTQPHDKYFSIHTHDICEIIYLNRGDVSVIIGEKVYKMPEESLVIFRANVPHRIRIDGSDVPYERHNILFDENKLAKGIFHKLPKELDIVKCGKKTRITELFEKIDYYYDNFQEEDLSVLIPNTVEEILYNLYLEPLDNLEVNRMSINPIISGAVNYINRHYTEPITIEDISREICVTKSHLQHLFVEHMNISPKKYVNLKRLSKAQKLIKAGEKPSEIFSACGFREYSTFFRNYSNYFGYTPSQKDEIVNERQIEQ